MRNSTHSINLLDQPGGDAVAQSCSWLKECFDFVVQLSMAGKVPRLACPRLRGMDGVAQNFAEAIEN